MEGRREPGGFDGREYRPWPEYSGMGGLASERYTSKKAGKLYRIWTNEELEEGLEPV